MAHAYIDEPSMTWIPVHKTRKPCPICGHPDFCSVNARWVLCTRVQSHRPTANGGWLHDRPDRSEPLPAPIAETAPLAPIEQRDRVYRRLWQLLPLSLHHKRYLIERGIESVAPYRTNPDGDRSAIARAVATYEDISGVPGFHLSNGVLVWGGRPGILIPVRDAEGRIQAVQVRADGEVDKHDRYRWVTSSHKGGASPGTPVHVLNTHYPHIRVWLTEGVLKATYAGQLLHEPWLAAAGISNVAPVFPILKQLGATTVVVAFDMDGAENQMVRLGTIRLVSQLLTQGYHVVQATWPVEHKGIDDCLIARVRPRLRKIASPNALVFPAR